jgi:hypothetical protein
MDKLPLPKLLIHRDIHVPSTVLCGDNACDDGYEIIRGDFDEVLEGIAVEFEDDKGRPCTNIEALDVIAGYVCNRRSQNEPCQPVRTRLEVRPVPSIAHARTDSL